MIGEIECPAARHLLRCGAVKFGEFRLKLHEKNPDAPLSPIYVDLRMLRSFPWAMREVRDLLCHIVEKGARKPDLLADVPTAATPIVALMSDKLNLPMVTPRLADKSYGSGARIDGVFQSGQRALLVDDLITRADSKLEAVAVLTEAGLRVEDVLVLVDREQGGREELAKHGMRLHAAFTLRELLEYYRAYKLVADEQYDRVARYLNW